MSPLDTPGAVRRFLTHWKPIAAAFVVRAWQLHDTTRSSPFQMLSEPRLAPLLLQQCKQRGTPTALLNVHVPGKEFEAWDVNALGRAWLGGVLRLPDLIVAQSDSVRAFCILYYHQTRITRTPPSC